MLRIERNKTFEKWDAARRPPAGEGAPIGTRRLDSSDAVKWPRYAVGMTIPTFEGHIEYAPLWGG